MTTTTHIYEIEILYNFYLTTRQIQTQLNNTTGTTNKKQLQTLTLRTFRKHIFKTNNLEQ